MTPELWIQEQGVCIAHDAQLQRLPTVRDAWRVALQEKGIGRRSTLRGTTNALPAAFAAFVREVTGSIRLPTHATISKQTWSRWYRVELRTEDDILRLVDEPSPYIVIILDACATVFSVVDAEYGWNVAAFDLSEIRPRTPTSFLDEGFFRNSNFRELEFTISYGPLSMSRIVPRHGVGKHDAIGVFRFDIIKAIFEGGRGLSSSMIALGTITLDESILHFMNAPAAESAARIGELRDPTGREAFLFYAMHALAERFLDQVEPEWTWRYNDTRYALHQLRRMREGR